MTKMGALLALLVNPSPTAKPLHHVETRFECQCSDTSSSSEEPKNTKHEPIAKDAGKT
jgi:hypothetical protein